MPEWETGSNDRKTCKKAYLAFGMAFSLTLPIQVNLKVTSFPLKETAYRNLSI